MSPREWIEICLQAKRVQIPEDRPIELHKGYPEMMARIKAIWANAEAKRAKVIKPTLAFDKAVRK